MEFKLGFSNLTYASFGNYYPDIAEWYRMS